MMMMMMMITIAMMIFQYQTRGGPRCAACLGRDRGGLDGNPQCCQGPNVLGCQKVVIYVKTLQFIYIKDTLHILNIMKV